MELEVYANGRAEWNDKPLRCALGRNGVREDKREGDGATPEGLFPMRRVLYRPDRISPPETMLPCEALTPKDGWCDDPDDDNYNCQVALPYSAHCESLWRDDGIYDLLVVLGYNDAPVGRGRGSAIFLHLARPGFAPTEGCIALTKSDLLAVLASCRRGDSVRITRGNRGF
jgi:L,D-peptidoglycan transpeptidase YkuD (ErfK/YbiS/YcfS/YnhG family)